MLEQNEFEAILRDIVIKIIAGEISVEEIKERIQNDLDANDIWECESLLITDCYYALKHIQEENISTKEWKYFVECFNNFRQYDLRDKNNFIKNN